MVRHLLLPALLAGMLIALSAGTAFATIHPIVESFDCANEQAFAHHPLGDPADPLGQTPGATPGNGQNELRALDVITDGFTDFSSPALFGHKLDEQCGHAGP
jgi:hypothetical protein